MSSGFLRKGIVWGAFAFGILAAGNVQAAGFGLFEHGSKAMGMAGAFTAQADDPSAMFHNAAGLAFQREKSIMAGVTYITSEEGEFKGAAPFPGPNATGKLEKLSEFLPHAYYVRPIGQRATFGFGTYAPFGLTTEWQNKATFSGRYLSVLAAVRAVDLNPTFAWQVTPRFGIGIGAIVRVSDVELERYLPQVNPFTAKVINVGKVNLNSDFDYGYGFNIGLLGKPSDFFSWGLSYRSQITVKYEGDARFTQISSGSPQLDAAVAAVLPFGGPIPVKTEIGFPDLASFGLAFHFSPAFTVEVDANWTGWSSFDTLPITFPTKPALSSQVIEGWEDAYNYRIGCNWATSATSEWRFGFVYDETPQPTEGMGPLLPDANRNGYTVGYGHKGARLKTDIAFMYLPFENRSSSDNRDNFFGSYTNTAYLLGATLSF